MYEVKRAGDNTAYAMSQIADLHQSEPESPVVPIIDKRRVVTEPDLVGDIPAQPQSSHDIRVFGSQMEKDREEYFADLEARKQRAADILFFGWSSKQNDHRSGNAFCD